MKKKKIAIIAGVVVLLAAAGGAGYYYREELAEVLPFLQAGDPNDKVYVEKVSKIMNQYSGVSNRYNGTVESQDVYDINVDANNTIKEICVEVGDSVEEGQELVIYDTQEIELQKKQAELELESIKNEIANYNRQIATLKTERDKVEESEKFSYTTEIQSLENSIEQSNFDLESKQLEIDKYKEQMENASVVSKVSGVVREINESGTDANGNTAAFMKIMKTGGYRVKGNIDETNVWTIADGQEVLIRSRVDEAQTWSGYISKVDTENTESNDSDNYGSDGGESATKYPFYVELASSEGLLLGQHVYIELDIGQDEEKEGLWLYSYYIVMEEGSGAGESVPEDSTEGEVLDLNLEADTESTGTAVAYVWVANEKNRLEKRYVELGEYDAELDQYQILSGLTEEDYIAWPLEGMYEGITTVTNADEVDYESSLYNPEGDTEWGDEYLDDMSDTEWGDEYLDDSYDTELRYDNDEDMSIDPLPIEDGVDDEFMDDLKDAEVF